MSQETIGLQCPECTSVNIVEHKSLKGFMMCRNCGFSFAKPETGKVSEETARVAGAKSQLALCNFEEAKELFAPMLKDYPKNGDVYWSYLLSKYMIKYEQDHDGSWKPTCCDGSFRSFVDDEIYKKLMSFASENKAWYAQQAEHIEKLRLEYLKVVKNIPPYDVFICFKKTEVDENGNNIDSQNSRDYQRAWALHNTLSDPNKGVGANVFFSETSIKKGHEYEPQIFHALNTAKIMIVYTSDVRYIETTWVKNEWLRWCNSIRDNFKPEGSLVVAFRDLNPNDLPQKLRKIQNFNLNDDNGILDLVNYLRSKLVSENKYKTMETTEIKTLTPTKKAAKAQTEVVLTELGGGVAKNTTAATNNTENGFKFLARGLFPQAENFFNIELEQNNNSAEAIFGKMMISLNCKTREEFRDQIKDFSNFDEFKNYMKCADIENSQKMLDLFIDACKGCFTNEDYKNALKIYENIVGYKYDKIITLTEYIMNMAEKLLASNLSESLIDGMFTTALKYYPTEDTDKYILARLTFALSAERNNKPALAIKYAEEILKLDEGNVDARWCLIKCKLSA